MAITATALLFAGAGAVAAGQAPSGVSFSGGVDRATGRRPLEGGALGNQLRLQSLVQLGAPREVIIEDFVLNLAAEQDIPAFSRQVSSEIGRIRNNIAEGDLKNAESRITNFNRIVRFFGERGRSGLTVELKIVDGKLDLDLTGPEGQQIDSLIGETEGIFQNRLLNIQRTAEAGAEAPVTREQLLGREQDQIEFLLQALNEDVTRQQDIQTERLNQLGVSPAGVTGELERVRSLLANDIRTTGGIERALTLEGGIGQLRQQGIASAQQALSPTLTDPTLSLFGITAGLGASGFNTAANLATASAEAEAARAAGISNAINTGGAGAVTGIGSAQGQQSTLDLLKALGINS